MNYRFISQTGRGLPMADRLLKEGHSVDLIPLDPVFNHMVNGSYRKAKSWDDNLADIDTILFDECGFGALAKTLGETGKLIYGSGPMQDNMATNKEFAQKLAHACCQMKPAEQDGIPFSIDAFYSRGRRVENSLYSVVPGQNAIMLRFWEKKQPKIARQALEPLEGVLRELAYHGPLGVNVILSDNQSHPQFLSFTTTFRWGVFPLICDAMKKPWHEVLKSLATGYGESIESDRLWHGLNTVKISPKPIKGRWFMTPPVPTIVAVTAMSEQHKDVLDALIKQSKAVVDGSTEFESLADLARTIETLTAWKYL